MKIAKKNFNLLFSASVSFVMALFMSGIMTMVNVGMVDYFFLAWGKSFVVGYLVAFPLAYLLIPRIRQLVTQVIEN